MTSLSPQTTSLSPLSSQLSYLSTLQSQLLNQFTNIQSHSNALQQSIIQREHQNTTTNSIIAGLFEEERAVLIEKICELTRENLILNQRINELQTQKSCKDSSVLNTEILKLQSHLLTRQNEVSQQQHLLKSQQTQIQQFQLTIQQLQIELNTLKLNSLEREIKTSRSAPQRQSIHHSSSSAPSMQSIFSNPNVKNIDLSARNIDNFASPVTTTVPSNEEGDSCQLEDVAHTQSHSDVFERPSADSVDQRLSSISLSSIHSLPNFVDESSSKNKIDSKSVSRTQSEVEDENEEYHETNEANTDESEMKHENLSTITS